MHFALGLRVCSENVDRGGAGSVKICSSLLFPLDKRILGILFAGGRGRGVGIVKKLPT